ncbi:RNA polymerase sigma factor sigC [Bienertia sinuspersici]
MENINVLEDSISDSELLKLEKDILVQLGRLGALQLFQACLSKTINMSELPAQVTLGSQASEGADQHFTKNVIYSKRKAERKSRQNKRLQAISKRCACRSESFEDKSHHAVSSAERKAKVRGNRAKITKNEAELSRGIKVVAQLEKVKAALEEETGRAVSSKCWAVAAGIDEKVCSMICTSVGIAEMNSLKVVAPWCCTLQDIIEDKE